MEHDTWDMYEMCVSNGQGIECETYADTSEFCMFRVT